MLKLKINGDAGKFNVNLPTSLSEISKEYLVNATKHIDVAPEHSLVALVYREKLAVILNSSKQNKEINTSVVPIFVKAGDTDTKFVKKLKLNDVLIITGSDLSLGIHVVSQLNNLSIPNIVAICQGDNNIYKDALTHTGYCYFIEFKLVPNNAIKGIIGASNLPAVDPYVSREVSEN